ncbi:MAG: C25 family cysteine peptidase [Nitrospirota bacterium]
MKKKNCDPSVGVSDVSCLPIITKIFFILLLFLNASFVYAAIPAGYSQYFVPGEEEKMAIVFEDSATNRTLGRVGGITRALYSAIGITSWTDNTRIYIDHWEDGYEFDPEDPMDTADEVCPVQNAGAFLRLISQDVPSVVSERTNLGSDCLNIPTPCAAPVTANGCYYDGKDMIYVAGGSATLTRTIMPEQVCNDTNGDGNCVAGTDTNIQPNPATPGDGQAATVQALAWEVYPVRPQLTTYIMPFGEDLYSGGAGMLDFEHVFALVQATESNTSIQVDFNGDGAWDAVDANLDGDCNDPGDGTLILLNMGQTLLLSRNSDGNGGAGCGAATALNTRATIQGSSTLQVNYISANAGFLYDIRGYAAFPRGLWDDEYYAPVDSGSGGHNTDIYIHNPWGSSITVNYQVSTGSGSITVPANGTVSFFRQTGSYVPIGSSVYLSSQGGEPFWAVSSIDTEDTAGTYNWSYPLVPAYLLESEYFVGYAPGSVPVTVPADYDNSGLFLAPVQDNTVVFVDYDADGPRAPVIYSVDRLQTQFIYDPVDGDLAGAFILSTSPFMSAWGENPDPATVPAQLPALDAGYTALPGRADWIDLVLMADKSTDPTVVGTGTGQTAKYTIHVTTHKFDVENVRVTDTLATGWAFCTPTTTPACPAPVVTLPDLTTSNAVPAVSGQNLTWDSTQFGGQVDMAPNQELTIDYWVYTTAAHTSGSVTVSPVRASVDRTIGDPAVTQTFTATDSVFNFYSSNNLSVTKTSSVTDVAYPGDTITYTVTATNTGSGALTGISVYDPLPNGVSYVAGSSQVTLPVTANVLDQFGAASYNNNNGSLNWSGAWTETDSYGSGSTGATGGFVWITGGQLQFRYLLSTVRDEFGSASYSLNYGSENWTGNWIEQSDDGSPSIIGNRHIYIDAGSLRFDRATGNTFGIYRDANVSGASSITISFVPTDEGFDSGEVVVAEYSVDGGGYTTLGTFNGGTGGWSGNTQTYTIGTFTGDSVRLRFRATGAWNANGDEMTIDNVQISYNAPANASGTQILRSANLAGATSAMLSFGYTAANLEIGDTVVVEASSDGGSFTTLETFDGATGSGTRSYNLVSPTNYTSANTTIRFRVTGGFNATDETFSVDNVDISFSGPLSYAAGDPPNFVSSSDGYSLSPGQQMTLTYNVTVDDPLDTGIDEIINIAYINSNEITVSLSASVTDLVVNPSSQSAIVGDRIWFDIDGDSSWDVGEPGLSNVEVTLIDQYGTPLTATFTDATGHYLFTNVTPGNGYYVEVSAATLPAGLQQTSPGGHSDNRTDPFNLIAGQSYSAADIGYGPAPGTATFGDLIWSDFDSDGVRDLGEPGLAGITVQLWQDTNGNLLLDAGTDSLISSTVTTAGGNYLFAGVAATGTEDYLFFIDPSQAALAGFTETTVNPLLAENVNSGDVIVNLDFGFINATGTYTIKDRVWYDADADSQDDGESGISGVTVDLLDASLNVIASTIADADGYFLFNGVIGAGADYTVRITDTGGILSDYYGITAAAIAGEVAINNLNSNLDFTVEPTEPSLGYGLSKSISGTVFNDLDGDGGLDAGEPGMGGIGIDLYNDVNGNSLLDGGDTLRSTLPTDSSGNYLFSGLNNGNYIISIPGPPSGYDYTTETPDNDPAAGHQQAAVVAGGGNVQNADFGYRAQNARSISGTLWEDDNADGVIDAGEPGLEGVTVELLDGSTVVASVSTDSNGNYSFSGLTPIIYTVRITDTFGVLAGYEATYEFDVGSGGPFDGEANADLSGGNLTSGGFGFRQGPVITLAAISDFRASVVDGGVVVSWDTVYEKGTIGFYLYRMDEASGEYVRVNDRLIPGLIFAPRGGSYRAVDNNALPGGTYSYKLVEIEARNMKEKRNTYGPFRVTALEVWGQNYEEMPDTAQFSRMEHPVPEPTRNRLEARDAFLLKSAHADKTQSSEMTALAGNSFPLMAKRKIGIKESGLYYLPFSRLPFVTGVGPWSNSYFISSQLSLKNNGQQVPYFVANDKKGIYFYGAGIDSVYTDENVYWAEWGRGTLMQTVSGKGPLPASGDQTFIDSVHVEEDTLPILALVTDPNSDYWTWGEDFIYAEYPGYDSQTFNFSTYGIGSAPADESASLTVHLFGLTDTDHHAEIWLNDEYVGMGRWSGIRPESFAFPINQTLLKEAANGENMIIVKGMLDVNVPYSWITVDSFDIRYHRRYQAVDDVLFVTGGINQSVTVEGFSNPAISVFDLSDPTGPKRIDVITIDNTSPNNYRVSFVPSAPETRYFVTSLAGIKAPFSFSIDEPSSLKTGFHNAAYILITPGELKSTAQNLARHRQQQGLFVEVVDIEDIMDEFNYGNFSPEAIHSFLTFAYKNWVTAPRYAVLIGEGTYDYKDFAGMGGNLIPPVMVSTPDGLVASDAALADVDGDHLPEIAIGRLPVLTAEELEAVINKIKAYETTTNKSWKNRIVMMADHPEEDADFPLDSDSVAALLPGSYNISKIYMSQQSLNSARTLLMNALQNGTGLINYIGHGGPDRLEQDGLLQSGDVEFMTNTKLPLLTAMTCAAGDFSQAGYDSLAELLLTKQGGGAIAIWSPAGYSNNAEAVTMDKEFFRSSYLSNKSARTLLGDVVLQSLENAKKNGVSDFMLEIYNIIGDPALILK